MPFFLNLTLLLSLVTFRIYCCMKGNSVLRPVQISMSLLALSDRPKWEHSAGSRTLSPVSWTCVARAYRRYMYSMKKDLQIMHAHLPSRYPLRTTCYTIPISSLKLVWQPQPCCQSLSPLRTCHSTPLVQAQARQGNRYHTNRGSTPLCCSRL